MKQPTRYCSLCGNNAAVTRKREYICYECLPLIQGPLKLAYALWQQMAVRHSKCCGGMGFSVEYLYFHGKGFEESWPQTKQGTAVKHGPFVSVEHGVKFYATHAQPYYIRDFEHYTDSEEYGFPVFYNHCKPTDEDFWIALERQFTQAAVSAWNDDLLTCRKCGYHMGEDHRC